MALVVFSSKKCGHNTLLNLDWFATLENQIPVNMGLVETIQQILKAEGELKAREITTRIAKLYDKNVTKSSVNSILYGYENVFFKMSKDFRWSLL